MEATTIPNDESARILAAAGWQSDPRRLPVLRDLLREHLRRIYLYSYEETRNRAAAIDRTRRTLLRVARTVQSIPVGCPLVTWIFLALEEARVPRAENPDLWRLLVIAEEERRAAITPAAKDGAAGSKNETGVSNAATTAANGSAASGAAATVPAITEAAPEVFAEAPGEITAGTKVEASAEVTNQSTPAGTNGTMIGAPTATASHPMLRPLVSLYRRFLDLPGSEDIEPRANWPAAERDLDCFLRAQFAETGDATCRTAPGWRRWLAARPWRRPRNIAVATVTVVVVAISFVVVFALVPPKGRRATIPGSAHPPAPDVSNPGGPAGGANAERPADNAGRIATEQAAAPPSSGINSSGQTPNCQIASAQAPRGLLAHGKASTRINGARCELITRDSLRFAWMPAQAVTEYRLCLITAKRDTLGIVPAIAGTCVTVPVGGVPGMVVPGSFIFRLDGLAGGHLIAVSDPQPFEVP
jgi:hypothetical protein